MVEEKKGYQIIFNMGGERLVVSEAVWRIREKPVFVALALFGKLNQAGVFSNYDRAAAVFKQFCEELPKQPVVKIDDQSDKINVQV